MRDDRKRTGYLEKACAAHDAFACFDRGQHVGRSKSATVKWYAEACRLGDRSGCEDLPMIVLASLVLDPVPGGAMDGKALRPILDSSRGAKETSQHAQERALALAVARLWAGDRKAALAEVAAADKAVAADQARLHVFAAYIELATANHVGRMLGPPTEAPSRERGGP